MSHPELFWGVVKPEGCRDPGKVGGQAKLASCARLLKNQSQQEGQEVSHIDAEPV
jgi:hypothetical protein